MRSWVALAYMVALAACAPNKTGADVGVGISALDTVSAEEKENDAWFNSYYGTNSCGFWGGACKPAEKDSGGGGGGFWGGGVGPSDSAPAHD